MVVLVVVVVVVDSVDRLGLGKRKKEDFSRSAYQIFVHGENLYKPISSKCFIEDDSGLFCIIVYMD